MRIEKTPFGTMSDGRTAMLYSMYNDTGMCVSVSDYGAVVQRIAIPAASGQQIDVVLGYDDAHGYAENSAFLGALVGRNANRIEGAEIQIDGISYPLEQNNGGNNLHGGTPYYGTLWHDAEEYVAESWCSVALSRVSPDGEQGFPGTLRYVVRYTLTDQNVMEISYEGISDRNTVFNPTNHSYFNLGGHASGDVFSHRVVIEAEEYTPVKEGLIPTGEILPVKGTPLDFRKEHTIGERIAELEHTEAGGYDHNYVLSGEEGVRSAARVCCPETGIVMKVFTDLPGMQFYSGNGIATGLRGKAGAVYKAHSGFCLETQYFPNACREKNFRSCVLEQNRRFESVTAYQFLTEEV